MLLQVEGLGAYRSLDAQFDEFGVHSLFVEWLARQTDETTAQVLAAVRVQVAEEGAELVDVADVLPPGGIGADAAQ